jgi:hypothetical protein
MERLGSRLTGAPDLVELEGGRWRRASNDN